MRIWGSLDFVKKGKNAEETMTHAFVSGAAVNNLSTVTSTATDGGLSVMFILTVLVLVKRIWIQMPASLFSESGFFIRFFIFNKLLVFHSHTVPLT